MVERPDTGRTRRVVPKEVGTDPGEEEADGARRRQKGRVKVERSFGWSGFLLVLVCMYDPFTLYYLCILICTLIMFFSGVSCREPRMESTSPVSFQGAYITASAI